MSPGLTSPSDDRPSIPLQLPWRILSAGVLCSRIGRASTNDQASGRDPPLPEPERLAEQLAADNAAAGGRLTRCRHRGWIGNVSVLVGVLPREVGWLWKAGMEMSSARRSGMLDLSGGGEVSI